MDIPELKENLKLYRSAWKQAGHQGEGDVTLRIPVYVGATNSQAIDEPWDSIYSYFSRMGTLYRESSGQAGLNSTELRDDRAERLQALSYEQILETKVAFGTGEKLVERFKQLEEDLGLNGIVAELNPGGLIPAPQVMSSLKMLPPQVIPSFK